MHTAVVSVARPKVGEAIQHWGIVLPSGLVAHCTPERGEHISSIEDFCDGAAVSFTQNIPTHLHSQVIANIKNAMNSPRAYHLTANNCETFVNRMITAIPQSPSVVAVAIVSLLALLAIRMAMS